MIGGLPHLTDYFDPVRSHCEQHALVVRAIADDEARAAMAAYYLAEIEAGVHPPTRNIVRATSQWDQVLAGARDRIVRNTNILRQLEQLIDNTIERALRLGGVTL